MLRCRVQPYDPQPPRARKGQAVTVAEAMGPLGIRVDVVRRHAGRIVSAIGGVSIAGKAGGVARLRTLATCLLEAGPKPVSGDDEEWTIIAAMGCGLFEAAKEVFPSSAGLWEGLLEKVRSFWGEVASRKKVEEAARLAIVEEFGACLEEVIRSVLEGPYAILLQVCSSGGGLTGWDAVLRVGQAWGLVGLCRMSLMRVRKCLCRLSQYDLNTHAHVHTHAHTQTQTQAQAQTHTYECHGCIHTYNTYNTCTHTCMHACIHTYIHTYNTYICSHKHLAMTMTRFCSCHRSGVWTRPPSTASNSKSWAKERQSWRRNCGSGSFKLASVPGEPRVVRERRRSSLSSR